MTDPPGHVHTGQPVNKKMCHLPPQAENSPGVLELERPANFTLRTTNGRGLYDGRGFRWWWHSIVTRNERRPILLRIDGGRGVTIEGVKFLNSPKFHINIQVTGREPAMEAWRRPPRPPRASSRLLLVSRGAARI